MAILFAMPVIGQTVQIQNVTNALAGSVTVNVDITGFTNAGAVTLHINYDQSVLSNPTADFLVGGSITTFGSNNGVLAIEWVTNDAMTGTPLTGQFVALHFDYVGGFATALSFTGVCLVSNNWGGELLNIATSPGSFINGSISPATGATGTLTIEKVSSPGATTITLPPPGGTQIVPAQVSVPINAAGLALEETGVIDLKIAYDITKLTYTGFTANQFTGWVTTSNPSEGTLTFTKTSGTALSVVDGALITINFDYLNGVAPITFQSGTNLKRVNTSNIPVGLIDGNVADFSAVNLKVFLEGLYNGSAAMRKAQDHNGSVAFDKFPGTVADQITVELHDAITYGNPVIWSQSAVNLNTDGTATVSVPRNFAGNYYLTVKHRNHLETVSKDPINFDQALIEYDFTTAANKASGDNQKLLSVGKFGIFAGDVDQNGIVDIIDRGNVIGSIGATGYVVTDLNGDGEVDITDRGNVIGAIGHETSTP